jgi:hypothetical protein
MSELNEIESIKEDLYVIGAKPIHFEMNNSGVRIMNRIQEIEEKAYQKGIEKGREEAICEIESVLPPKLLAIYEDNIVAVESFNSCLSEVSKNLERIKDETNKK